MLRAFCLESGKDWDDGLPLLMFAVRESVQESLGFSPAKLVFAHTVRGPLKMLKEQLIRKLLSLFLCWTMSACSVSDCIKLVNWQDLTSPLHNLK